MLSGAIAYPIGIALSVGILMLRRPPAWTLVAVVAVAHLTILASVAFFPIPIAPGIGVGGGFDGSALNLRPFATLGPILARGASGELRIEVLNLFVLFPAGIYLPILIPPLRSRRALIVVAIVDGAALELGQLAISIVIGFAYRAIDIDDAILNAAGLALGLVARLVLARQPGAR